MVAATGSASAIILERRPPARARKQANGKLLSTHNSTSITLNSQKETFNSSTPKTTTQLTLNSQSGRAVYPRSTSITLNSHKQFIQFIYSQDNNSTHPKFTVRKGGLPPLNFHHSQLTKQTHNHQPRKQPPNSPKFTVRKGGLPPLTSA